MSGLRTRTDSLWGEVKPLGALRCGPSTGSFASAANSEFFRKRAGQTDTRFDD